MAFWRHLFRRRRRVQAASAVPAVVTSTAAVSTAMRPPHRDGDPADPRLGGGEGTRITASGARTPSSPGGALLLLREEHVAALRAVLEGYRRYTFQHVLPTTERNERLRQTQALLGRLHALAPPSGGECWLSLSPDELSRLQQVLQVVHEQPMLRERWRRQLQTLAPLFGWEDGAS